MSNMKEDVSLIVKAIGGAENVQTATHCVTRLRLLLKDPNKVNVSSLDNIDIVKGNFLAGGQFQIVIGPGVEKVYHEFIAQTGAQEISQQDAKKIVNDKKNPLQKLVRVLGDIFIPILPAIVAAGLLMGINNILANPGIFYEKSFIEVNPEWAGIEQIINLISSTAFTFLPALVGFSAVKKFGGNPVLGIVLGLVLVNPSLMSAYDYASDPSAAPYWNIFGLHVNQVGYQGQVIPVIVASWILAKLEQKLKQIVPDSVQMVIVSPVSLLITGFLTFIVIGPVTMAGANLITDGILALFDISPVIAGAVYALISPPLVITGMHHLFLGVNLQMAGTLGYVTLWPIGETVTMATGAATLTMYFVLKKQKNKKLSNVSLTATISAWLGITEPAIYGINLRFRYPFIAVMLGSACGSAFLAANNIKATSVGVGGIFSFLSVFPEMWGTYFIGEGIAFAVTVILTLLFWKSGRFTNDEFSETANSASITVPDTHNKGSFSSSSLPKMHAFADGTILAIEAVKDEVFSTKIMGNGVAIEPTKGILYAPSAGEVMLITEDTYHACGLRLEDGREILLHIGVDTVDMNGDGFEPLVKTGEKVTAGTPLIRFNLDKIKKAGHESTVILVITKDRSNKPTDFIKSGIVNADHTIIEK